MSTGSAKKLYTPQVLALAMELAEYPLSDELTLRGEARPKTCGSRIEIGLLLDEESCIAKVGLQVEACAIGQASAAIFAANTKGCDQDEICSLLHGVGSWIDGKAPSSILPRLELLEPAREHPARHGAIILPWQAALYALCSSDKPR